MSHREEPAKGLRGSIAGLHAAHLIFVSQIARIETPVAVRSGSRSAQDLANRRKLDGVKPDFCEPGRLTCQKIPQPRLARLIHRRRDRDFVPFRIEEPSPSYQRYTHGLCSLSDSNVYRILLIGKLRPEG